MKKFVTKIKEFDISNLTESEIERIIYADQDPDVYCGMPVWMAKQIINLNHVTDRLKDWAWGTLNITV